MLQRDSRMKGHGWGRSKNSCWATEAEALTKTRTCVFPDLNNRESWGVLLQVDPGGVTESQRDSTRKRFSTSLLSKFKLIKPLWPTARGLRLSPNVSQSHWNYRQTETVSSPELNGISEARDLIIITSVFVCTFTFTTCQVTLPIPFAEETFSKNNEHTVRPWSSLHGAHQGQFIPSQ